MRSPVNLNELQMPTDKPPNIVVVGPAWVGDMVIAQSLFRSCKAIFPQSRLTVLAPSYTSVLLARMPEVDMAIEMPFRHGKLAFFERQRFGEALRAHAFDWAIVLPNSFKSALIPFWARVPKRTGYLGECRWGLLNDIRRPTDCPGSRLVDRFNYLIQAPNAYSYPTPHPQLRVNHQARKEALDRYGLHSEGPVLALCPGAEYGPAKRWPPEYFAEVARQMLLKGWRVWVFGAKSDIDQAAKVCQLAGPACINLAGRTGLLEAIDLLSVANAVVTNDSGLMHIASSLTCKVISIFGSTDPANTPPLGKEAGILASALPCRPCFARTCRYGHYLCLHTLTPDSVLGVLNQ